MPSPCMTKHHKDRAYDLGVPIGVLTAELRHSNWAKDRMQRGIKPPKNRIQPMWRSHCHWLKCGGKPRISGVKIK